MNTSYPMSEKQQEFLRWRFGLFLHFNVSTFTGSTWATGYEDPAAFAPDRLDCEQWADAAVAAGMGYAVLTVKHTGGWCLWQSDTTAHDMGAFLNHQAGQGDLVADFTRAFRSRGLKVGLYYCGPGAFSTGKYGPPLPPGKPDLQAMPPEASPDYVADMKAHFTELLTRYGTIDLIWFDQWNRLPSTIARWQELRDHIYALQPATVILANNAHDMALTDIYSCEYCWDPTGIVSPGNPLPAELSDNLATHWFWPPPPAEPLPTKSASEVVDMLTLCNSRNANYLLNVPPDRHGLIAQHFVERLRQIGALRTACSAG